MKQESFKCLACGEIFDTGKRLSNHFKKVHNLTPQEYAIKYVHDGISPSCLHCGKPTRFVSAVEGFKQYCSMSECRKIAYANGGKKGGKLKKTWNKGQTKETNEIIARQALAQMGEGNAFYGKVHTAKTKQSISFTKTLGNIDVEKRLKERGDEFELLTPLGEYFSRQKQYLEFKCKICGTKQFKTLQSFERGSRCYRCYPISKSNWELSVLKFVQEICPDARSGDRKVISPKEIDIFIPSKQFGIECHGLYWHSEAGSREFEFEKSTHLKKAELASEKSIKLFQIFEDDWRDRQEICKSMIRHRLGITLNKAGARKFKLVELNKDERKSFFETSHISGDTPAMISWGLKDSNGVTIAAISLRKPRHVKKYESMLEVARFATLPNHSVSGGLQRLFKPVFRYARKQGYNKVMTYVDRLYGDGHGYEKCGFKRISSTGISYWYTDNEFRYDRFKFRAQDGMSEADVAREARVSKIYGCGSYVYVRDV